ncbi:hypothetical protein niasHS_005421 [Heterodera schachtii]|uniref:Domain of unknown function DB domain-containing protein n=2 Tax=Heterodera TaxID=34509 RepID=A0ABD2J9D7_HETSC
MSHIFSAILLLFGVICIRLAKCQFPFGQQQQWYPAQNQWVVPSWQQQQQPVIVQQQQPWHHHHHHDDHHHHPPPPPIIVHHDHHDDHHHHVAHYAPIRNNGNAGDGNANNVNQQSVIPYRQEQFSPLGFDLTEAAEGVGSTPSEFQEQLPELYKTPTFIEQPQTVQQQPNLSSSGNVNNEFVAHNNNNKQQQHRVAVSNSRPTTTANGGGGAVQATQRQQQTPGNNRNNKNNKFDIGGTGPRRRITTAAVRLPAGGGGATAATNPALVLNNNGNNNKLGTNGNGIQHQQQLRKLLLLTGPTTTTKTTPATTTTAGPAIGKTKLVATKRPAVGPPAFAPPKIDPHSQAVPAKQPIESAISREFDLPPPPPPSRFLPDVEKLRIDELLRQKATAHQRHDVDSENFQFDEFTKFSTISSTISSSISETTPPPLTVTVTTTETTVRPTITTTVTSTLARLTAATAANAAAKPTPKSPNESFLSCCRAKRVPKSCESRCNFDVLSKKILTALFLNTDKCPSENGLELFTCAAQDSDHTDCCKGKKVQRTSAGNKCLAFCNLSPDAPRVQADASYLPCWAVLNEIKNCFRDKLTANLHI